MSILRAEDNKKWIHSFLAVIAFIVGHLVIRLMGQLGEWFDLEAKIPHFLLLSQGLGILLGLSVFIFIIHHQKASRHINEVYSELVKVVWPEKESVAKSTVGIIIAVAIVSTIFVGVDFTFGKFLELLY